MSSAVDLWNALENFGVEMLENFNSKKEKKNLKNISLRISRP